MKHLNTVTAILLFVLLHSAQVYAAGDDTHMQQVETLFRLTQMEKKINESVDSILLLQLRQNPQLSEQQAEIRAFFEQHIGWDALKSDIANMYIQTFSEDELKAINAFYITPAGQKVINELPQLVQQRNQLAMQRIQQNLGELQKIVNPPVSPSSKP